MGMLWEVVQTGLMHGRKRKSDSAEDRVRALEDPLQLTQDTLPADAMPDVLQGALVLPV